MFEFLKFNFSNVKKIGETMSKKHASTSSGKAFEHNRHERHVNM